MPIKTTTPQLDDNGIQLDEHLDRESFTDGDGDLREFIEEIHTEHPFSQATDDDGNASEDPCEEGAEEHTHTLHLCHTVYRSLGRFVVVTSGFTERWAGDWGWVPDGGDEDNTEEWHGTLDEARSGARNPSPNWL